MAKHQIKSASPMLTWLNGMLDFFDNQDIKVPPTYRGKVLAVKDFLKSDITGLLNSVLDFAINAAVDVNYSIETSNVNLAEKLNSWLYNINSKLRGKIPTGIDALAKEYYRERWKGSSFMLLRSVWENVDGVVLPTKMWFVDGEDILVKDNNEYLILGEENYALRVNETKELSLPTSPDERLFVQKPYTSWGIANPEPYIIQRGLYKNAKVLELLVNKGNTVIAKALEYLLLVKKGTEALAKEGRPEFIYSDDELLAAQNYFGLKLNDRFSTKGVTTHFTNFDTDIEALIPDYEKALKSSLYSPIEKRILAGLGMIDIIEGTASTRKESLLNPKPFIGEVQAGINDFKSLITDIIYTIIEVNKGEHKKYFSENNTIEVRTTPIKLFMTDEYKTLLRSLYDRGVLSKRSFVEIVGNVDFDLEIEQRKQETMLGLDKILYPHLINNQEQYAPNAPNDTNEPESLKKQQDPENTDKTGPEADNFTKSDYEQAPYNKNSELPDNVKTLPSAAQSIWRKSFNAILSESGDEDKARKIAWNNVKIKYQKKNDKWAIKTASAIERSLEEAAVEDIIELKKLQVLGKQSKLLDRFLSENADETIE